MAERRRAHTKGVAQCFKGVPPSVFYALCRYSYANMRRNSGNAHARHVPSRHRIALYLRDSFRAARPRLSHLAVVSLVTAGARRCIRGVLRRPPGMPVVRHREEQAVLPPRCHTQRALPRYSGAERATCRLYSPVAKPASPRRQCRAAMRYGFTVFKRYAPVAGRASGENDVFIARGNILTPNTAQRRSMKVRGTLRVVSHTVCYRVARSAYTAYARCGTRQITPAPSRMPFTRAGHACGALRCRKESAVGRDARRLR